MTHHPAVVYVLMACHNRRVLTVKAVQALLQAATTSNTNVQIVLFDDGSTDGTAEAVVEACPNIHIISGDGSAYWARSMATAEAYVLNDLQAKERDYLLWLNDDVVLEKDALSKILRTSASFKDSVIVGAVCDPVTGLMTYSGFRRYGKHPLHLAKIAPRSVPIPIESFNGNIVLVPIPVAKLVGGIDGSYSHAWADLDYGFRCQKKRTPAVLAAGYLGKCPPNMPPQPKPIWLEWKAFLGTKGAGNFRSLRKILQLQSPRFWVPQLLATYVLWWGRSILRRMSPRRRPQG